MQFPLKLDSVPFLNPILTPTNVAILASLGVHAFVMGLALPSLQGSDNENQIKGQVGVVELTETEKSRLPDASPFSNGSTFLDPASLPSGSNPPGTANIDPALNLPPANTPLPGENYNYNSSTGQLPSQSSLPPLPPLSETLPSYPSYPSYPRYPNLPGSYAGGYSSIPSYPGNYGSLSRLPVTNPPLPSIPSSSYSSRRPFLPGNPINTYDGGNRPSPPRPQFDNSSPPKGTDFISKAPQGANLPGNTNSSTNTTNVPAVPVDEPGLVAQGQDTSSEDALRNDLYARAKYGNLTSSEIEVVNLVGNYPRIACRNRTEASVVYYVDPSGAVTRVSESRYPIFNTSAQQIFQSQRFVKPTRVTVNFKYDPQVCASMATANPTAPVINTPSVDSPGVLPPRPIAPEQNTTPLNTATQPLPPLPMLPSGNSSPVPNGATPPTNLPVRNDATGNNTGVNKNNPPVQVPSNARVSPNPSPNAILSVPQTVPSVTSPQAPETSVKPGLPPIPKAPTSNIPLPQTRPSVVPSNSPASSTTVKTSPLPSNLPSVSPPKPEAVTASPTVVAPKPKPETLSPPNAGTNFLDNLRSRLFRSNPPPQNQPTPAVKPSPPELSNNGEVNPVSPPNLGKK